MVVLSEHCSLMIVVIVVIFVSPTHPSPQPHSPPRPVCHTCSTLPPLHHYSARWEPLDLYIILQTNPTLSRENHIQSHIENHFDLCNIFGHFANTFNTLFALGENVIELQPTKYCPSRSHVAVPEYPRPKLSSLGYSNQSELFHFYPKYSIYAERILLGRGSLLQYSVLKQ